MHFLIILILRYLACMERKAAEEHFLLASDGSFAVRISNGNFVITLKHKGVIRHIKIISSSTGYLLGVSRQFASVPALGTWLSLDRFSIQSSP